MPTHALASRAIYSDHGRAALIDLEARLTTIERRVFASEYWRALTGQVSSPRLVRAFLREVMRTVCAYQPLTTEAGFAMLGRLPKHEVRLLSSLVAHKAEEAGHALWAQRDAGRLGDGHAPAFAECSPATFAVAAVWQRMATVEDPFGYLGAEFLFEALTARLTPLARDAAVRHGIAPEDIGFIADHAVEDVKHTNLIVHWILDIATRYPERAAAMRRCFDCFAQVYPEPVWQEAFDNAQRSIDR